MQDYDAFARRTRWRNRAEIVTLCAGVAICVTFLTRYQTLVAPIGSTVVAIYLALTASSCSAISSPRSTARGGKAKDKIAALVAR